MKKKLVVMCMLFITCVVTSCSGNNNGKTEADNIQTQTFPQQYRYSSEHLRIDLQEITPQEVSWKNGTATECSLDYEKVGRVFMPDDGSNTLDAEAQMISSNAVSDGVSESFFTWGLDSCTYTDLEYLELNACLKTDRFYSDYNLSEYTDSKEFTFASEEAAKQEIYEIMDSCGIDLKKDFTCETYYLDHEILQQQEEHMDMDGNQQEEEYKTDWSEENDTYLFYFHHVYSGLRDFQGNSFWQESAQDLNAQITVMYNKKGIIFCYIQNLYDYTSMNESESLLNFDAVMQSVIEYFEGIVDGADREVISAELIVDHMKDGKTLIPVWAFQINEKPLNDSEYQYELRVNAITGKIIVQ